MESIHLYDTTLRDGTQGEDISFSAREKLMIALKLDELGIQYIEGGFPGSNPRDKEFFKLAKETTFKTARICAFGTTRKPGISVEEDKNIEELLNSDTPVVTIFGKSWDLHVKGILQISPKENLAMISDTVSYLKAMGKEVIYDAEHFFDGYKENPSYALETLLAAVDADAIVLCDTNGGSLPDDINSVTKTVTETLMNERRKKGASPVTIGIHTHNDCGLATANSLSAVDAGATMVHGTINGYGERCGNADLTTLIPLFNIKKNITCVPKDRLKLLTSVSRFVSDTANMTPVNSRPFVGKSAFAHKGGVHVNAVMKESRAYEHMDPTDVGNKRRVLVSDLSGKSNVDYKMKEMGITLNHNGYDGKKIVSKVKEMEQEGYQFDSADGSFKILIEKLTECFTPHFDLESFRVTIEKDKDQPCSAHATIKISVDGNTEITAAEGEGPVSALDNALRKALYKFYPSVDTMRLVDFKVRVIDGRDGTSAKVRVTITSRDKNEIWNTIGVSEDIIEASWMALADSFHYKLGNDHTCSSREQVADGVTV